MYKVYYPKT